MGEDNLTQEEREADAFSNTYNRIKDDILNSSTHPELGQVFDWYKEVIDYNVPHGKRNRGLGHVIAYKMIAKEEDLTGENVELSRIIGWCIEMLQAYFLVTDDVMDRSLTRRGRPCWYKKEGVDLMAINDALFLESTIYVLLRKHLSDKECYVKILELFMEVNRLTIYGQTLDMLMSPTNSKPDYSLFTMKKYSAIVKFKTAFYTFSLPVRAALYLAGINDQESHETAEKILLKIGHFFQVQDDYLDCFGDHEKTGKIGTDIEDGKCCWIFITALGKCSLEQKKLLLENYGKDDPECVRKVKKLYDILKIKESYLQYENQSYKDLKEAISNIHSSFSIPKEIFHIFISKIYKREK